MKRTLFEERNSSIWIKIDVSVTMDNKIIVSGHDSGKIVQQIKNNYDYEYFITIEEKDVDILIQKISNQNRTQNRKEFILDWFKDNFSSNQAISSIKKKLKELDINYQFSVW